MPKNVNKFRNPETKALLKELSQYGWFANVGKHTVHDDGVVPKWVKSWEQAHKVAGDCGWPATLAVMGSERLVGIALQDEKLVNVYRKSLEIVGKGVDLLMEAKVLPILQSNGVHQDLVVLTKCILQNLCMEIEFMDVSPPGLFFLLADWYGYGHFPCGWKGSFMEGRPIVY
jgi:hypothetical protein